MASRMQVLIQEYLSLGGELSEAKIYAKQIIDDERNERMAERDLEKTRIQAENAEKERLANLEQARIQAEQTRIESEHEFELKKLQIESQRISNESDSHIRLQEMNSRGIMNGIENSAEENVRNFRKYDLGLPKFTNDPNELDAFIARFELVVHAYRLPEDLRAVEFAKCLTGTALQAYETMSIEDKLDYNEVIRTMRRRFGITVQSLRKRFLSARCLENERQKDFVSRLRKYYLEWLEKAGYKLTVDDIIEHIILDRYYQSQSNDLRIFLRERGRLSLADMTEHAENYIEAHTTFSNDKQNKMFNVKKFEGKKIKLENAIKPQPTNEKNLSDAIKPKQVDSRFSERKQIVCFSCGQAGHRRADCPQRNSKEDHKNGKSAACQVVNKIESNGNFANQQEEWPVVAMAVQSETVYLKDLKYPLKGKAKVGSNTVRFLRDTGSSVSIVKESLVAPEQYTGTHTTVLLADRCVRQLPNAVVNVQIPNYEGPLRVCVMSEPVSALIIGNDLYASEEKSDEFDDIINDDEIQNVPKSTLIFDNSKYQKPLFTVCASHNRTYKKEIDSIVGDDNMNQVVKQCSDNYEMGGVKDGNLDSSSVLIHESHDEHAEILSKDETNNISKDENVMHVDIASRDKESSAAVQTRSQRERESKSLKPLKVTVIDALNIKPDEFRKLQETDAKLQKLWQLAVNPPVDPERVKHKFEVKNGLLYRKYRNGPHDEYIDQLVVPSSLEQKVISYAHDTALSGHGSIAATTKKLSSVFHILGASGKCKDFVKSCLICQKGGNKNTGFKAPMFSMPVIRNPFETVYVDLVGEIHPASEENHRWILCATDACTHFPIAVAMKKIDSISIAETLLSQFSIFGHPRQIICDNAANLTSDILKEIYRIYGIEIQQIPVYRPQANSVQERSHAHIKSILRKLCNEQPKQWHRYIDPLLFAIRTTENANKFTPFELLFGRMPHTHMDVLRELWTGQSTDLETKTTYQYVLDLKNRIEETCKLAQEEIAKTHVRNKRRFDKRAKLRELKPQQKVLVLSPKPSNKLEFIWKGPATVVERRGVVNYRIKFKSGKERLYHINMLKPFVERKTLAESETNINEGSWMNMKILN
jgi:hypothetical protein